jgi:hypothetical protein
MAPKEANITLVEAGKAANNEVLKLGPTTIRILVSTILSPKLKFRSAESRNWVDVSRAIASKTELWKHILRAPQTYVKDLY